MHYISDSPWKRAAGSFLRRKSGESITHISKWTEVVSLAIQEVVCVAVDNKGNCKIKIFISYTHHSELSIRYLATIGEVSKAGTTPFHPQFGGMIKSSVDCSTIN